MLWRFADFELDTDQAELRQDGRSVQLEPQVFDLLRLLVEEHGRIVTRDEIFSAIWGERIVSDAALSGRIRDARKAIGDDGATQRFIRTVPRRGLRFVGEVTTPAPVPAPQTEREHIAPKAGPPSIAVMRFHQIGGVQNDARLTEALPAEVISGLAKVHGMRVISRASSFQFDPEDIVPSQVQERLSVGFLLTGLLEVVGEMFTLSLEVQSASDSTVVWSDRYAAALSEFQIARRDIVASVVSSLELAVPKFEADQSRRLSPDQFSAWSHFHLGLSHIYRFNQGDNRIAAEHFEAALRLDAEFGRAHAGLSFTHWQNAFMRFGDDPQDMIDQALHSAKRAVEIDDSDPFANFNMGRAQWLSGDIEASEMWLDRTIGINPNSAKAHYNRGLILTLEGQSDNAISSVDQAKILSPLDPLKYAMHAAGAMSLMAQDRFDEASRSALLAVRSPGAHFYIDLIAAAAFELKGDCTEAGRWRDNALAQHRDFRQPMFFSVFPFRDAGMRDKLEGSFTRLGLIN